MRRFLLTAGQHEKTVTLLGTLATADDAGAALVEEVVVATLEKYQECPNLLDPHLEAMMAPLVAVVRDPGAGDGVQGAAFGLVYTLTKVRGYKTILKLFSHETTDFHPVLGRLEDVRCGARPAAPPLPTRRPAASRSWTPRTRRRGSGGMCCCCGCR